ncbi:TonB-dependent receptor [Aliikangiella marina]|uniref:TonB-dependent receptor n=1 Tax=Aliikangiella marina TaxID=1712262 RepID=A0A545T121_9GAMM|nr:TonB-dependent receptor [Aliikangiella marina]TQV70901.1 TonB-dependent receptor [Aliikangiella marina]
MPKKNSFLVVSAISLLNYFPLSHSYSSQSESQALDQQSKTNIVAESYPQETNLHEHEHEHEHQHESAETLVIQATRLGRVVDDEPIRVELINREEIEEKALMRPGNISMLVAETGGVRVQTTSPALGSANIRLQALYGRYTQLLSDGLPLYGGQTASIGLLQIPPTDIAGVEIIKGSASSLYGGSALGGVINLISRRPKEEFEGEVLLNFTSRDGQDLTTYFAMPKDENFSSSLTVGVHSQSKQDLDSDGWADLAGYERISARPRLFWNGDNGQRAYATLGMMTEQRDGGTLPGRVLNDGNPFQRSLDSERYDLGVVYDQPLTEMNWNARASIMDQKHEHQFGTTDELDEHRSILIETSLSGYTKQSNWVVGVALQSEEFQSDTFPVFNYSYDIPGLFSQVDYDFSDEIVAALSGRIDWHSEYGTQFSPRISILFKPDDWTIRGSYGQGYYAPTPFVEDIEAAGLSRLAPLAALKEEQAETYSLDINYDIGKVETGVTFFSSVVDGVTELEPIASISGGAIDRVRLINSVEESRINGSEVLLRYKSGHFKLTASYVFLDSNRKSAVDARSSEIPLTPRHSAGFVAMWEEHGSYRLGLEAYYTGEQLLESNPYRNESKPYWHLGLLGEITVGKISWFVNAENLLNIRQTKEDPLLLLERAPSGRWTTDIWSRNDGFIVNAGFRVRLGN